MSKKEETTMKHIFQNDLKPFLTEKITDAVAQNHLTTDKAAELLAIDSRSYSYIKSGATMCSTPVLVIYLTKLCPNVDEFIRDAKEVLERAEEKL